MFALAAAWKSSI